MSYLFPFVGSGRRVAPTEETPKQPAPAVAQSERLPLMPPSLRKIFIEVCDRHGVKPSELAGRSMARKFVAARREFIWRSRRETRHTFSRIATAISRDHTTAVHQYHRVAAGVASIDPHVPNDLTIPRGREIEVTELRKAGVPWKEIAKRMGISENAVRSYHSIARRRMKMARKGGKDD